MDISYCNEVCPIGKAARDKFLDINNSALDAATDFRFFTDNCFKACQFKSEHLKREQENKSENI